jgi:hypothetical protein
MAGCAAPPSGTADETEFSGPWKFSVRNGTFDANAQLRFSGPGEAIGSDLRSRPADLYELDQTLRLKEGTFAFRQIVATEPGTYSVISSFSACSAFAEDSESQEKSCIPSGMLRLAAADQDLFFGAPRLLDQIRSGVEHFNLTAMDAGQNVVIPFIIERTEGQILVRSERKVEIGNLEPRNSSSGDLLECNVLEDDILIFREDEIGCREAGKGFEWWTSHVPLPRFGQIKTGPSVEVEPSPHGVIPGTHALPFPIEDAIRAAERDVEAVRGVMSSSEWELGEFKFMKTGSTTIGNVECVDYSWDLGFVSKDDVTQALSTRTACADGRLPYDRGVPDDRDPKPVAVAARRLINVSVLEQRIIGSLLCGSQVDGPYALNLYVRNYTGEPRPWIIAGYGMKNMVTVDAETGYVIFAQSSFPESLENVFRQGTPKCPSR